MVLSLPVAAGSLVTCFEVKATYGPSRIQVHFRRALYDVDEVIRTSASPTSTPSSKPSPCGILGVENEK